MSLRLPRTLPLATTAILAMVGLWLGSKNLALRQENSALRTAREIGEISEQSAQAQLKERTFVAESMINELRRQLHDQADLSRLQLIVLTPPPDHPSVARATAIWEPISQTGLLTVENLPTPADEQDYQLWVTDPAQNAPVSCGVFQSDPDGHAKLTFKSDEPIKTIAACAISLENKGGAAKAEGPIVLLGRL